jgi:hypothetical protein
MPGMGRDAWSLSTYITNFIDKQYVAHLAYRI